MSEEVSLEEIQEELCGAAEMLNDLRARVDELTREARSISGGLELVADILGRCGDTDAPESHNKDD